MALSSFSERSAAYDSTPIENLFLLEYMPYAPGDYVRVYLYGLMQCHHPDADNTLDGVAKVLNLKPEQVLQAFRYWEQKGLVVGLSDNPPSFEYLSVRNAMMHEKQDDDVYQYREYLGRLSSMFEKLEPRHYAKAMEWVEDLKLPQDVVLTIAQEKLEQLTDGSRRKYPTAYLMQVFDTTALDFASRGIRTVEDAKRELMRGRPSFKLAIKVLGHFSLRRSPTLPEIELADKWLTEWGLDEKAVLQAIKLTTNSTNPSFAYLDRILQRQHEAKQQIEGGASRHPELFDITKRVLSELGYGSRVPSEDQQAALQHWLDQGFEPEVLLRAAVRCNRSGKRTLDQLDLELNHWKDLDITTVGKAEEYNRQRDQLRAQAAEAFSRAGIDRRPTEADLDQLREWLRQAPMDLVLFAADCAHGLKLPTRSMQKNLSEWARKGVRDVEAAKSERAGRSTAPKKTDKPEQRGYQQRSYQEGFFDDFFADLDGKGEKQ